MERTHYSPSWKRSTQPRKQRKSRYNAPLHQRQKYMHVHLSAPLRKKYGFRNVQVRVGDKVKVCRGRFAPKEGRIDAVNLKREFIHVAGVEIVKKDGSKVALPLHPSNVVLTELDLADRRRKEKMESKSKSLKSSRSADEPKPSSAPVKPSSPPGTKNPSGANSSAASRKTHPKTEDKP